MCLSVCLRASVRFYIMQCVCVCVSVNGVSGYPA